MTKRTKLQISLESIEAMEERARLWDTVFNLRLTIFPPDHKGGLWVARSNGGAHDSERYQGTGRTPDEAVQNVTSAEDFEAEMENLAPGMRVLVKEHEADVERQVAREKRQMARKPARKKGSKRGHIRRRVEVDPLS